ncbi:hypothetical protein [Puniceibacterium sp. IMCC21224]|uniref:hypothetical protein n=1 Tax=Puniceibacterium sp. IMCC21224 TaxID=1618204 RepID=UPI00064D83E7|nr:hypothetical protein [Puniceibacterium sp. IMCC21224]KMK63997.1 hypothetical protein IMCC21224_1655 [Puniceibacterium sp. IMCC21224]
MRSISLSLPLAAALWSSAVTGASADFVIADAIATPKLCAGTNCIDGEVYGTEQIKVKGISPRLSFDDLSSNTGGYPFHDWQLLVNDADQFGRNLFAVNNLTLNRMPFAIEGAAPTNALYVAGDGNIGIGTALPASRLHIASPAFPGMKFDQTSAGGRTPYTWDMYGYEFELPC